MQLWRRWLSWTATGLVVGFLVGAVLTFTAVRAHHYVQYGMSWLIVDTTARLLERGTLVGTAAGLALGLTLVICGPPVRYGLGWVSRRVASLRIEDERNVASLIGAILTGVVVLVAGWIVLNERFIPFQYGRRYWVLNVGWGVGSIIGTIVLYRLLLQVPILPWLHRRGRGILWATCVPLLVVLGVVHVVRIVKRPMPPAGAPSIILLTVDTTRADHLSVYGYSRRTTPHLEELAKEGRVYAYCYSHAPVTSSSFSCIMSGHRPKETGTYGNDPVPDRVNTLAEYLANAGYETAAVVSNFVLKKSKNHSQGYRYYDDAMDDRESNRHTPERIGAHTTQAALRWLQNAPHDRPFLLWVHYQDPHGPYTPPREYQSAFLDESAKGDLLRVTDSVKGQGGIPSYQMLEHHRERGYYVAQYDAEILYYDQCLHDLVDGLRSGGWWDSSLVVWTSDHGEGMGEHEYYFAHGDYLYPSQLRVPLGLWGKGVAPGVVDSTLAQSSDIVPTVLAAAGIEPRIPLPGRNLLAPGGAPSGPHRPVPADAMIFSETLASDNYKAALTSPALQLVYDQFNADYQPYDPATDVFLDPDSLSGSIDLAKVTARLEELRNKNASRSSGHGMSDQEAELMKSLGYIN